MRVIKFVHKIKDSEGGEGDYDEDKPGQDCSDDFNFLGV